MEDILTATVFHDAPPGWFDQVSDLKPGGKRRLADAGLASYNGRAYHLYDFREKRSEVYEPQMTLAQRLAVERDAREAESLAAQSIELPTPQMAHVKDWPADARAWLHAGGLNNDDIGIWGAYWAPKMGRVVLPLHMLDGSDGWIARKVGGYMGVPKYLFPQGMKRGGGAVFRGALFDVAAPVIVEDALSAWRIAYDTGHTAVAALGTSLDRDAIVKIAAQNPAAIVWMDPDKYGQLGAHTIRKQLGQLGVEVRNVISARDPKFLTAEQIVGHIRG